MRNHRQPMNGRTRGARLFLLAWMTAGALIATGLGYRSSAEETAARAASADQKDPSQWKAHDMARPHPPVVAPAKMGNGDEPGKAPSDAVVLFDGKNLDAWQSK